MPEPGFIDRDYAIEAVAAELYAERGEGWADLSDEDREPWLTEAGVLLYEHGLLVPHEREVCVSRLRATMAEYKARSRPAKAALDGFRVPFGRPAPGRLPPLGTWSHPPRTPQSRRPCGPATLAVPHVNPSGSGSPVAHHFERRQ